MENRTFTKFLPHPVPITEQVWDDDEIPLVCTRTMTFNHEKFIRECLDGILMQRTTFPVRIVIHDDASTDNTPVIIREYEQKYPRLIRVIYQKENTYRLPDKFERRRPILDLIIGKYTALCEGDDYWTDPLKLQKQIEVMEANEDCYLSIHNTNRIGYDLTMSTVNPEVKDRFYDFRDFVSDMSISISTCSIVHRRLGPTLFWAAKFRMGDWPLLMTLFARGKCYYFGSPMGVYRKHAGGASAKINVTNYHLEKIQILRKFQEVEPTDHIRKWVDYLYAKWYFAAFKFELRRGRYKLMYIINTITSSFLFTRKHAKEIFLWGTAIKRS